MPSLSGMDQILGQETVVASLTHDLRTGKYNHAYLFLGRHGTGKKTLALSFAAAILCTGRGRSATHCGGCPSCKRLEADTYADFSAIWDKGGESIKIDQIKEIISSEHLKKQDGDHRIIFIENAERLTVDAANALLKILEEPLPGTIFLISANNEDSLPATVLSRMEKYWLKPLSPEILGSILEGLGYGDTPYLALGTIDEARVLLDNANKNIPDYEELKETLLGGDLEKLLALAERLAGADYLKELLSYYELKAAENYRTALKQGDPEYRNDLNLIDCLEEAGRRMERNVSKKNSLEYCFLHMGGIL